MSLEICALIYLRAILQIRGWMKEISQKEYEKLIVSAKVLEKDKYGDKVLLLPDSRICKIFRCKRTISSAKYYPYVMRFKDNAEKLPELGIKTVDVENVYKAKHIDRDIVVYKLLEGETLRDVFEKTKNKKALVEKLIDYISELHAKGVYFRSLHFGNVLVLSDGSLGLIDISDMKITSKALGILKRIRNFRAVFRYEQDKKVILDYGLQKFLDRYISESEISPGMFYTILKMQKRHPAGQILYQGG